MVEVAPRTRWAPSPHSSSKTGVNALKVGEGWGGGSWWCTRSVNQFSPPPLAPPHKGEGNSTEYAARS